jgi:hypothetical protein
MPDISISQSTFERLQKQAKPLVDTVDSVINRALDAIDVPKPAGGNGQSYERIVAAGTDMTHTKVLDASVDGRPVAKPNWNKVLDEVVRRAMQTYRDFDKVSLLCPVNMMLGRKEDEGYGYLPDIDVSIQGQDANAASHAISRLAHAIGLGVDIGFIWRQKTGAAFPGMRGRLKIDESKQMRAATGA